jgi:hypothetical protein
LKKPRPKIKAIIYAEDKFIHNSKIREPSLSEFRKKEYIRRFLGQTCAICHKVPTKVTQYELGGISLVEKYCDNCIETIDMS